MPQRPPVALLAALCLLLVACTGNLGDGLDDAGGGGGAAHGASGSGGSGSVGSGGSDGGSAPQPQQHAPCEQGSCWDIDAYVAACGFAAIDEDFSSGNYNVHRYASQLWADTKTTITLTPHSGMWAPAIIVADQDGSVIYDGEIGAITDALQVSLLADGRDGQVAQLVIDSSETLDIDVYVTAWEVIDSGFVDFITTDASYTVDIDSDCSDDEPIDATAPPGAINGEQAGFSGDNAITLGGSSWGPALRFDLPAETHLGFRLTFAPSSADVDMQVLRWTGSAVEEMAVTNGGSGERVLAVLDARAHRTYWVRARGSVSSANLKAELTPFEEGAQCQADCDRMLQLPLANDPSVEGYDSANYVTYRYQFGRRDVLMSIRHAGRVIAASGGKAFTIQDLSKADGSRPPGHASHDLGKDVDISVYDAQGNPVWYPLCAEVANECIGGTDTGFHGEWMARKIAPMLESGRVTYVFLDVEFHDTLLAAADDLVANNQMSQAIRDEMEAVVSHWPNHNNHIHVRWAISPY